MGVPGQSHPGSSARRFQGAGDRERIILMQRRRDLVSFRGASLRGTRRAHLGARTDRAGRHPRDGRRLRVPCPRHDRGHAGAVPYIPHATTRASLERVPPGARREAHLGARPWGASLRGAYRSGRCSLALSPLCLTCHRNQNVTFSAIILHCQAYIRGIQG